MQEPTCGVQDRRSAVPLHLWAPGSRLRVVQIAPVAPGRCGAARLAARKLSSLGILPGSTIRVIQAMPLPVIAIGNSVFAIDRAAAAMVMCVEDGEATVS